MNYNRSVPIQNVPPQFQASCWMHSIWQNPFRRETQGAGKAHGLHKTAGHGPMYNDAITDFYIDDFVKTHVIKKE